MRRDVRDGVVAGLLAGAVSGLPSTLHAVATGRSLLESTLAAGSLAVRWTNDERVLLAAGASVHATVSAFWGVVLARGLPRANPGTGLVVGGAAGIAIAALDLGLVGRTYPRIRRLPLGPQLADHVAYGAAVGFLLARLRRADSR